MTKRKWKDTTTIVDNIFNYNTFNINSSDFDYLFKLYKFTPLYKTKTFYDNKRGKIVAMASLDKITNKYVIIFNKDWLFEEAITTKCDKVIDILKRYQECFDVYHLYRKIMNKQMKTNKDLILKEYYNE